MIICKKKEQLGQIEWSPGLIEMLRQSRSGEKYFKTMASFVVAFPKDSLAGDARIVHHISKSEEEAKGDRGICR